MAVAPFIMGTAGTIFDAAFVGIFLTPDEKINNGIRCDCRVVPAAPYRAVPGPALPRLACHTMPRPAQPCQGEPRLPRRGQPRPAVPRQAPPWHACRAAPPVPGPALRSPGGDVVRCLALPWPRCLALPYHALPSPDCRACLAEPCPTAPHLARPRLAGPAREHEKLNKYIEQASVCQPLLSV